MDKITFKKTILKDLEEIKKIEETANTDLYLTCDGEGGYKKAITETTFCFIEKNGKTVGIVQYDPQDDGVVIFRCLVVLPKYQNKGIATKTLKKLINDLDYHKFALYTHPQNTPALLVYLRLGFKITKWIDNFYGIGQPRLYLEKKDT